MNVYVDVAVNYPERYVLLTYCLPLGLNDIDEGDVIDVPLGKRIALGVVFKVHRTESSLKISKDKIKSIIGINPTYSKINSHELKLYQWVAKYYHYGPGQLIFEILPEIKKLKKSLACIFGEGQPFEYKLTEEQNNILKDLLPKLDSGSGSYLIHGVTGSGKSIIYLHLINKILQRNQSVLFLLPEINLTPQLVTFLKEHVKGMIIPYHSGKTPTYKKMVWEFLYKNLEAKIIVGVRSSIFLPIKNLGLIIVDEEHDNSFKQEERCSYNSRDVAIQKAKMLNIPLILGSATPSLETYVNHLEASQSKRFPPREYFTLKYRAQGVQMPEIEIIGLKENIVFDKNQNTKIWPFTQKSIEYIKDALDKNEQVLIFINRLGYSNYLQCRSCGFKFECKNCSTSLKYFRKKNILSCHFCDFYLNVPLECPQCSCLNLSPVGFGTEKICEVLSLNFPNSCVERFDRDEIKNLEQLEQKLDDLHNGKIDILVGTQMISKGHNFKRVNLVLILGIDMQLNLPDFRSLERCFQTLVQVSGRSGRYEQRGKVVIQTLNPESELFSRIKNEDFLGFYNSEINVRKALQYPPFSKMAILYIEGRFKEKTHEWSKEIKKLMDSLTQSHFKDVTISGPISSVVERKKNQFRWSIILKSSDINQLHNLLTTILKNAIPPSSIKVKLDIDPLSFL